MQISTAQVFAFVEGGLDRPFVERLLSLFVAPPTKVRVVAIKETAKGTGGKPALIGHFRRLRRKGHLLANAWGKPFVSLFFLDKDADDALGKILRSPHVAYTPTYDLEGALFHRGNLLEAVSDACHVTRAQAECLLGDVNTLLLSLSRNWADWVTLCLMSQYKKKNFGCTFDRVSQINLDPAEPPDLTSLADWKTRAKENLCLSDVEFDRLYCRFKRLADSAISAGEPLKYFRGKWINYTLQKWIERQPRIPDSHTDGVSDRVLAVLVSHVANSPDCPCCRHYADFVQKAVALLSQETIE